MTNPACGLGIGTIGDWPRTGESLASEYGERSDRVAPQMSITVSDIYDPKSYRCSVKYDCP